MTPVSERRVLSVNWRRDPESWYFAIAARKDALLHWLLGHDVRWRVGADELCPGDIICEKCPSSKGRNLAIWCRAYDPWEGPR